MSAKALGECVYTVQMSTGGTSPAYKLVSAKDANLKEFWYRDAIFEDPELVVGVCRRAGLVAEGEVWFPWAKEFALDTGSIDVMLLSSRGRIGIVETKLSFNLNADVRSLLRLRAVSKQELRSILLSQG